jgi:hypothetical protein
VSEWLSHNWAGYIAVSRRHTVECVEGWWIQPKITCPPKGYAATAIWVGIDGTDNPDVGVRAGATLVQVGSQGECTNGTARYFTWTEALPAEQYSQRTPLPVAPGDRMWVVVRTASDGRFAMQLINQTTGGTATVSVAVPKSRRQTAEWVVEAVSSGCPTKCRPEPLAEFGSVALHGQATIAGARTTIRDAGTFVSRTLMTRKGVARVAVSALNRAGTRFSVHWKHR